MSHTAVMAGAYLHHLAISSGDPKKLAAFYARAIDMRMEPLQDFWLCPGPARRMLFQPGASKTLAFAAFACRDQDSLFCFIEDSDGNWIEISAELEVVHDRPVQEWPHEPRTLNLWGQAIMRS